MKIIKTLQFANYNMSGGPLRRGVPSDPIPSSKEKISDPLSGGGFSGTVGRGRRPQTRNNTPPSKNEGKVPAQQQVPQQIPITTNVNDDGVPLKTTNNPAYLAARRAIYEQGGVVDMNTGKVLPEAPLPSMPIQDTNQNENNKNA